MGAAGLGGGLHQFHLAAARGQKRDDGLLFLHFFEVRHVHAQRITPERERGVNVIYDYGNVIDSFNGHDFSKMNDE